MVRYQRKNKRGWLWIAALCLAVAVCTGIFAVREQCYAYTETAGTVIDGPVQMRESPVDGKKITSLATGTAVRITDETTGSDGKLWYQVQISYNGKNYSGYMRSDYILVSGETAAEESAVTDSSSSGASGTVSGASGNVYVRTGASTAYSQVTTVTSGQTVTVLGQTTTNGVIWYNITFQKNGTDYTGWICGNYLTVMASGGATETTDTAQTDADYAASLKAAGFPDSYVSALTALHQKYPSWQFVAVQTGLDWQTAVAAESTVGRNLVQSSSNDARKSTETGAYDWATNRWYGYDGDGWVSASSGYIAYCMDPRNYLNETYIFQFETLEYAEYQNAAGVSNLLAGTFMSGNYTDTDGTSRSYADTFLETGVSLGVSPYHLAARCKQEQGSKGTSALISGSYSGYAGYYNYFNIGAYTTSGATATVNGLKYAKNAGWDSIYKSILGGAGVVGNNYVKKGQNTLYFQKFNVVYQSSLYTHQYMTNVQAALSEGKTTGSAYSDKSQAFVFRIPVYSNMPEQAVTFSDSGNPNNWLSQITVSGYSLTPTFQGAVTEYSLIVGTDVSTVTVNAQAVAPKSSVSGTGTYALNYGTNTVNLTCVSQSGSARTYTLNIVRTAPETPSSDGITIADGATVSTGYTVGTYVTGIAPGSSASDVLANISASGCSVKLCKADGTEQTGAAGTGNLLIFTDGNGTVLKQYEIVVYGDMNGDGKISVVDLVLMQKQILGTGTLSGASLEAADAARNGGVSVKDLVVLQKQILNVEQIRQS